MIKWRKKQTSFDRYYSQVLGLQPKSKQHHKGNTDQQEKKKRREMIIRGKQYKKIPAAVKTSRKKCITGDCILKKK